MNYIKSLKYLLIFLVLKQLIKLLLSELQYILRYSYSIPTPHSASYAVTMQLLPDFRQQIFQS